MTCRTSSYSTQIGWSRTSKVRERAIGLIDARESLKDPDAMDVGLQRREGDHSKDLEDVNAVTSWDTNCYRCGGLVHRASDCSTPKVKGGEKGGRDDKGKGKGGNDGKGKGVSKGEGDRRLCTHCGKVGRVRVTFPPKTAHGSER